MSLDDPPLAHPQLQRLCSAFGLTAFEAQLLLLALGVEISPEIAGLCATCNGADERAYATFRLAIALFPGNEWRSLTPAGALRFWDLVVLDPGGGLLDVPLRLSEFALHWLCGVASRDRMLMECLAPLADDMVEPLPASQAVIAGQAAALLGRGDGQAAILLRSPAQEDSAQVARAAAVALGLPVERLRSELIAADASARRTLAWMILREQALCPSILFLELGEADDTAERQAILTGFVRDVAAVTLIVSAPPRFVLPGVRLIAHDVAPPTRDEQLALWRARLGDAADALGDVLGRFDLRRPDIDAACRAAAAALQAGGEAAHPASWRTHVTAACRAQRRWSLERFAERLPAAATLDDLVLPAVQHEQLRAIVRDVAHHPALIRRWLAAGGSARGLGLCALFTGPAGAGKTTAAEALARALDLDLFRVDLSAVVSKYIGETEKQLNRVFDAAEGGASLLLFDESDALFGKRTDVRDSHDRYANQEVSFLLQKLETHRGLVVLTSNLPDALDAAFLRRFRYIVDFPLPGPTQREALWRKILGRVATAETLDFPRLARLNLSGGHISNVALQAAFLAAADGGPVSMEHVHRAAAAEYRKLHRTLSDEELGT